MKKSLVVALVMLSQSVFALSTGTLVISGNVTPVNDILITPNSNATSLAIVAGETNKLVASVAESSNNLTGYKIYMKSASGSKLVHGVDLTKSTPYTVSYNGATAVSLTPANVDQQVKNISSLSQLTTNNSNVNVNVTAYPLAPAGTYSDTITISIVANN